ncbi:hypothetical protein B5F87_17595 [Eubacterium sp. An3]|nr:hypothetical protein B5F87_17595 [Eubacterium sp. An3]
MSRTLIGTYHKTLARDEATGYTYFLFCPIKERFPQAEDGLVTCYGKILYMNPNTPLSLKGIFNGNIFTFSDFSIYGDMDTLLHYFIGNDIPASEMKILMKVSDGDLFSFCCKVHAERTLSHALSSFPNGDRHAKNLVQGIQSVLENKELFSVFQKLEIPYPIFEKMTKASIPLRRLQKNPFLISYGMPVYEAEKLMAYFHDTLSPYDTARVQGYIMDALITFKENGDTCCSFHMLCEYVRKKIAQSMYPNDVLSPAILFTELKRMETQCICVPMNDEIYIYIKKIWEEENTIIQHAERIEASKAVLITDIDVASIERKNGFPYNNGQRAAFQLLKSSGIKFLIGPPGSGKTAIIKGLEVAFKKKFPDEPIVFLATTGAASQVMKRSTGENAETVHKCLGIRPMGQRTFTAKDINNPINARFIIVDEVSMLDMETCAALLPAVQSGALLLLVGDADQLQSVSYGNILFDFIHSGMFEVYRLTEVMRQSGTIYTNAKKIRDDEENLTLASDFQIFRFHQPEDAVNKLLSQLDIQRSLVLSPVKDGLMGVHHLNALIQPKTGTPLFRYGHTSYYQGDRIIMTETDYQKGYFNGDIGEIVGKEGGNVYIRFPYETILVTRDDFGKMSLAYAITVHKSQGSEKEEVHIMLPNTPTNMLTRRLLYTAVTRAKKKVVIYYIDNALSFSVHNTAERPRITNTAGLLRTRFRTENIAGKN